MARQRIIVIGGVASGPAAAVAAKRTDPEAEVWLLEQGRAISYGACEMPYLVSGIVEQGRDLEVLSPAEMKRTRGVEVRTLHRVLSVDPRSSRIEVEDRATAETRSERWDKLILATGATVAWPDIEGLQGDRVHAFRTLDHAERVAAVADSGPQRWLVAGGGFVGLEVADQLATAGHRVTVLSPGGPLPGVLAPELQGVVAAALLQAGIALREARVTGVRHGVAGAPLALRLSDGERVGGDQVLVATGIRPEVTLARAAGLRIGSLGGIVVDDRMRTSHSGIWACGDCVEVPNLVSGRPALVPLSPIGFRTGRTAGTNAARTGRQAPAVFTGAVGAYALKVAGIEIAYAGLSDGEGRAAGFDPVGVTITHASRAARMPGREQIHVHLIGDRSSRRLLGGQLVGREGAALRSNVLVPLLRGGASVDDLYEQDLVYTPPVAPSLDPLLVAARKLQKALRP